MNRGPGPLLVALFAALFAEEGMIGVEALNFPYNFLFTGFVHLGDVVVAGLAFKWNGVHALYLAAHDIGGRVGGFNGDIE